MEKSRLKGKTKKRNGGNGRRVWERKGTKEREEEKRNRRIMKKKKERGEKEGERSGRVMIRERKGRRGEMEEWEWERKGEVKEGIEIKLVMGNEKRKEEKQRK